MASLFYQIWYFESKSLDENKAQLIFIYFRKDFTVPEFLFANPLIQLSLTKNILGQKKIF